VNKPLLLKNQEKTRKLNHQKKIKNKRIWYKIKISPLKTIKSKGKIKFKRSF